jgi:hypothetical protein
MFWRFERRMVSIAGPHARNAPLPQRNFGPFEPF